MSNQADPTSSDSAMIIPQHGELHRSSSPHLERHLKLPPPPNNKPRSSSPYVPYIVVYPKILHPKPCMCVHKVCVHINKCISTYIHTYPDLHGHIQIHTLEVFMVGVCGHLSVSLSLCICLFVYVPLSISNQLSI